MENYALWSQVSDFQILSTFLSPNLATTRCPAWYHEVAIAWTWRGHPRRHILNAADSSLHRAAGRFGKVAATGIGGFMRLEVNKIQIIFFTGEEGTQQWIGFCRSWGTKTLLRSMTKVFYALQMDLRVHSWHFLDRFDCAGLNRMGV